MRRTAELRRVQTGGTSDLGTVVAQLLRRSAVIAGYHPVASEPHVTPRLGWLLPILLPDGDLDWAHDTGEYVENHLGLREPVGPRLGVHAIAACDLVLVPALAVDRRGYRLGRGGGSYDRALPRTRAFTVALLHDGEFVDEVPTEPHDVPVDALASPSLGLVKLPITAQEQ